MAQIGRRGSTNMTVPLMIGAFVLLAGFLYWLSITAEPTAPPEIVEEDPEEEMMEAQTVDPSALESGAAGYVGLTVRLDDVNVAQAIGDNAFFVDLPRTPFLVHMSPDLSAVESAPPAGRPATVVGEVREMNDSTINAWAEGQEFTENDRPLIEFATHYIEAFQIRSEGGDAAPGGDAGADADAAGDGG
ncbi:MAG: hypothetical protein RLN75_01635 [Longimicrobiales bacterium]